MSDLPNHCIHVVSDTAIVFRPSISDSGLYLCSVKRRKKGEEDEVGLFFEAKEAEELKAKCQIM